MKFVPLLLLPVLAACAQTPGDTARAAALAQADADRLGKLLAGFTPGDTSICVPSQRSQRTEVYGDKLVVRDSVGSSPVYVADTGGGCQGAERRGDIIVTVRTMSQMCQGDIIQTRDQSNGFFTGSCTPGPFTRYERKR